MATAAGLSTGEKYDVFLSFRGPDTRESFADCLFEFLKEAGLRVFMDDEELHVGEFIGGEIQKAIYDSKLFVPIFSKGFASSKWCLMEIAWMADYMEEFPGKKEMLPIFYDVDASDVKIKTDLYTKALLEHEKTSDHETVERWRKALIKVPEVKGWNRRDAKGQGKLIRQIGEHISRRLEVKHRILPDHFIGIDEQVQDIIKKLDCRSMDVRIVVIHGMGGIGKTTLASAVFNKIYWQFQECSFLSNVRESSAGNGIVNLQKKFLHDTQRFSPHNFCDANDAMKCLKKLLENKHVLVVLDDVSNMDQIRNLIGMGGDWVGLGSRVIITTRNLSCIVNIEEIESNVEILRGKNIYIHRMRELGFYSSLRLLCQHAFDEDSPPHGYQELSRDILSFTKGIPLAIEVLGSYLKGKRMAIWKEMLKKLKKVPNDRLYQEILMSTYGALSDEEKEIFLDIAFFFAGHDKITASYYWDACNRYPETSIDTLISYALVKIVSPNKLWMHDIIRDLGREVVRQQSIEDLGRRSRLCNEDAKCLLSKGKGTKYMKALKLDSAHNFTPAQLLGLSHLQFLELCGGNFIGQFGDNCLSKLVWLSWRYCPLDFRGTNLNLENLVVLRLLESEITDTWAGWEQLKTAISLKELVLEGLNLIATPVLASFESLERLVVRHRDSLARIDPSISNSYSGPSDLSRRENRHHVLHIPSSICKLKALSWLEIKGFKLKKLPENIGELKGLKVLWIEKCESLRNLLDSIGDLEFLCELHLLGNEITELPESIGMLGNLNKLVVRGNQLRGLPATIGKLGNLNKLDVRTNQLRGLPATIGKLGNLNYLDVSRNQLRGLPATIGKLGNLNNLDVSRNQLRGLPSTIGKLGNLNKLDVSSNQLRGLPATIGKLGNLNKLDVRLNQLIGLPATIGELGNLNNLDVSCNQLRGLPATVGKLGNLNKLVVRGNQLRGLPAAIGKLGNLNKLDVSCNQLRGLPATIGALDRLEVLSANNNRDLQGEIPSEFGRLKSLKYLNLSLTGISGLPSSIHQLSLLESLILKYCDNIRELPDLPTGLTNLCYSRSLKAALKLSITSSSIFGNWRMQVAGEDPRHIKPS